MSTATQLSTLHADLAAAARTAGLLEDTIENLKLLAADSEHELSAYYGKRVMEFEQLLRNHEARQKRLRDDITNGIVACVTQGVPEAKP